MTDNLYLTLEQLNQDMARCLGCKTQPCMKACPLGVSPKDFIAYAKNQDYSSAVKTIYDKNPLGLVCGLVCPDTFCMKACTRSKLDGAVKIPQIQAALIQQCGEQTQQIAQVKSNGLKVAVIGSGPAGIGAVWKLLQLGFYVELFEGSDKIGGSLNLIPEERLSRKAIEHDYQCIFQSGHLELHLNTIVRKPEKLLEQGYSAVIIAVGIQEVNNLGIDGEEHIVSYVDYLSNPVKYVSAKHVAIIGGGKVAADCALIAHKQKAKSIQMVIRRTVTDMRMSDIEREELKSYGAEIVPLSKIIKISKQQEGLICHIAKTQIVEGKCVDDTHMPVREEKYDLIIKAIGGSRIAISDNPKIICAGDCKNGATTVVEAVASGVEVALRISAEIQK